MAEETQKPDKPNSYSRAPWYLHLLWALLAVLVGAFILAALGFGGVEYGYIEIAPMTHGGCRVVVVLFQAIAPEDAPHGCLRSGFKECQIVFGSDCASWIVGPKKVPES